MYQEEPDDYYRSARHWLDRSDVARAAELLASGDFVRTDELEHQALADELRARNLVCLYDDGYTWVWTPEEASAIAQSMAPEGDLHPLQSGLETDRRPARRSPPAGPAARKNASR